MKIEYRTLTDCHTATGAVVVVDVLRAFSAAAFAFAAGAKDILLVSTSDEAFALKQQFPGALIFGENRGLKVEGFDFGNSPTELARQDLTGRRLVQRTSAGTQGVVRSTQAGRLLVGSFVCAAATVRYLRRFSPEAVTFVITGRNEKFDGDEDLALAEYLAALLGGEQPNPAPYLARVPRSTAGRKFADPAQPDFPATELDFCTQLNRFNFAMQVVRRDGLLVLQKTNADSSP